MHPHIVVLVFFKHYVVKAYALMVGHVEAL